MKLQVKGCFTSAYGNRGNSFTVINIWQTESSVWFIDLTKRILYISHTYILVHIPTEEFSHKFYASEPRSVSTHRYGQQKKIACSLLCAGK